MKKILASVILLSLVTTLTAQEQDTHAGATGEKTVFGVKTGINVSILSASVNSEGSFKTGFHLGVYIKAPLGDRFYFRPEVYYSRQGQKDNYESPFDGRSLGETTTTLNYLNIPLLFETGKKVNFQFGLQAGILLAAREKGTIDNEDIDDNLKDLMRGADCSAVLGLGFSPAEKVNFGVRYNFGLIDVFKADEENPVPGLDFPDVKNRVFHFYLACSF